MKKKIIALVIFIFLSISLSTISVNAHSESLNIEYDDCLPDYFVDDNDFGDGYYEKWYQLYDRSNKSIHMSHLITNTTDDSLEEFVINELFDDYKEGKDYHINERTNKQHQIINTFFEMIKNKDILPFKEYCHEKIELIGFQDFILNTLKLDETLIDYRINSEYSLFNGSVFVVVNTKNEKMTLKIVFNTDDIVIGIWIVEFTKHNS